MKQIKSKNKILNLIKNPFFQYILLSSILLLVLLVYFSQSSVILFFVKWTTIILNYLLNILTIKTRMNGDFIMLLDGSQIKFQIAPDCTGIYPFVILTSLMIGFPFVPIIKKILGILLAALYTILFNFLRLILLFVIARHSVKWFEIAHIFIWQVSFVLLIVLFFFWWIQWARKIKKKTIQK